MYLTLCRGILVHSKKIPRDPAGCEVGLPNDSVGPLQPTEPQHLPCLWHLQLFPFASPKMVWSSWCFQRSNSSSGAVLIINFRGLHSHHCENFSQFLIGLLLPATEEQGLQIVDIKAVPAIEPGRARAFVSH